MSPVGMCLLVKGEGSTLTTTTLRGSVLSVHLCKGSEGGSEGSGVLLSGSADRDELEPRFP